MLTHYSAFSIIIYVRLIKTLTNKGGRMEEWLIKIASVIVTVQGIRYTEAKIRKLNAEIEKIKAETK